MPVNVRKNITLKNRTKYFSPEKDRTHVTFMSPKSWQSRSIKIEGYETRLYWQYRYCDENSGQTFFYTLTYATKNLPEHYGMNCFDYMHLEDLLFGGLRKYLWRNYGTRFKYFVGAELGDGKGVRGFHNNPHYHVLFFLEPCPEGKLYKRTVYENVPVGYYKVNSYGHKKGDVKYKRVRKKVPVPYVKISPVEFRFLVRKYWQGFDEDEDKKNGVFHSYEDDTKYGIAKEGENVGLVTDFRACMYCAKYVCKDVKLISKEPEIGKFWHLRSKEDLKYSQDFHRRYFDEVLNPLFNIPLNSRGTKWQYNDYELVNNLIDREIVPLHPDMPETICADMIGVCREINTKYDLWKTYYDFRNRVIDEITHEKITEWRNRYSNKCRISQGVGDYALNFVDPMEPRFEVPTKKGVKFRPLSMYYYRKLYTKIYHPVYTHYNGKTTFLDPIRVLNDLGIQYKCHHLSKQLEKTRQKAETNFNLIFGDRDLFEDMRKSDVNTKVFYHYDEFLRRTNYLLENEEDYEELFKRYAEYKLVYEDRYYRLEYDRQNDTYNHPAVDCIGDYKKFLVPSVYSVSRSDLALDTFLESTEEDWLSYFDHPRYLPYIGLFGVLDLCADYFFVTKDKRTQNESEERSATKRFHDAGKLREFYAQFGLK